MIKKELIIIIFIISFLVFSGCNEILSKDVKTILIEGCEWDSIYKNSFDYRESVTYVFFDDGDYMYESTWYNEETHSNFLKVKSSGKYHIVNEKLYLVEDERQQYTFILYEWVDVDPSSYDFSLELIDSNNVKIGSHNFWCYD